MTGSDLFLNIVIVLALMQLLAIEKENNKPNQQQ